MDTIGKFILFSPDFSFKTSLENLSEESKILMRGFASFLCAADYSTDYIVEVSALDNLASDEKMKLVDSTILLDYAILTNSNAKGVMTMRFDLFQSKTEVKHYTVQIKEVNAAVHITSSPKDKIGKYVSFFTSNAHYKLMNSRFRPVAEFVDISSGCSFPHFSAKPNFDCILSQLESLTEKEFNELKQLSRQLRLESILN